VTPFPGAAAFGAPPFKAWVGVEAANVRKAATGASQASGLLRYGDVVEVTACRPACEAPDAWVALAPFGHTVFSALRPLPVPPEAERLTPRVPYYWGRIPKEGALVYESPGRRTKHSTVLRARQDYAFVPDEALAAQGWLLRPDGRVVPKKGIRIHTPSTFKGEENPRLPLAFVIAKKTKTIPAHKGDEVAELLRYDRVPVVDQPGAIRKFRVETDVGAVASAAVRIAYAVKRPPKLKRDAKWVRVDIKEQALVAYEGDTPVFATVVATGKCYRETLPGLYPVWHKSARATMTGPVWEPYLVEDIPFVMYFNRSQAFHTAFWHDRFGQVMSHGCVNLAPHDAEWLFRWSPVPLPEGWRGVNPAGTGLDPLWVWVDGPKHLCPRPASAPVEGEAVPPPVEPSDPDHAMP
jgi:hypothetical protein